MRTYRDKLKSDLYPGRTEVPKTLIFAKTDSHAEDIVEIVREEFGKGNEFCKKITYRTSEKAEDLISAFRNSYDPRVAVTVDMISTGTDVRPLEVLIFMRDVKSQHYYEQMVGRGTRTISGTDLLAVTPDAESKIRFVLIDAVGVTESAKNTDVRPLERKPGVSFEKLLEAVAFGARDADTLTSLASRLARLDRQIDQRGREAIAKAAEGKDLRGLAGALLDAVDPDVQRERAREASGTEAPTAEEMREAAEALAKEATGPFAKGALRKALVEEQQRNEQVIDTISTDETIYAGYDYDKARQMVHSFRRFIEENKDELLALQILYGRPYSERHLTDKAVRELADSLGRPPYYLDPDRVWEAYERLEESRVRGASSKKLLTNVIALVRFAIGKSEYLEPYPEQVERRFARWLKRQPRNFTPEQLEWLAMIKEHVAASLTIEPDDFDYAPFNQRGGQLRASRLFGPELPKLLDELNEELAA